MLKSCATDVQECPEMSGSGESSQLAHLIETSEQLEKTNPIQTHAGRSGMCGNVRQCAGMFIATRVADCGTNPMAHSGARPDATSSSVRAGRLVQLGLGAVLELDVPRQDLAVPKLLHHFQHLGPGREHLLVHLLVCLDRHAEFELLRGHFAFLRGLAVIASASPRPGATLEARVVATVNSRAALRAGVPRVRLRLLTTVNAHAP